MERATGIVRIASQSAGSARASRARPICLRNRWFRLTANPLSGSIPESASNKKDCRSSLVYGMERATGIEPAL